MLSSDEMPKNNEDLATIDVEFPHVPFDEISKPNEIESHLIEYLEIEGYAPDEGLTFLRTAQVKETVYWIWEFTSEGEKTYATATQDKNGDTCVGCETDYYGLTAEQFILGDYHNCF